MKIFCIATANVMKSSAYTFHHLYALCGAQPIMRFMYAFLALVWFFTHVCIVGRLIVDLWSLIFNLTQHERGHQCACHDHEDDADVVPTWRLIFDLWLEYSLGFWDRSPFTGNQLLFISNCDHESINFSWLFSSYHEFTKHNRNGRMLIFHSFTLFSSIIAQIKWAELVHPYDSNL